MEVTMQEAELLEQETLYPIVEFPDPEELPTEDGVPLESPWHRAQINLLLESLDYFWQDRTDYYAGGNMFLYYSRQQVRKREYNGPDFFIVQGVDGSYERKYWAVWEEGGRYPDLIIELLSPSTARQDKTTKKELYDQVFHTPEYYCYDPDTQELFGWHRQSRGYEALDPDPITGRLWSGVLNAWIGRWEGKFIGRDTVWMRFFTEEGQLIPIIAEAEAARAEAEAARAEAEAARAEAESARAEAESARAEAESARAEAESARANTEAAARQTAEAEIARLQAELAQLRSSQTPANP
ncbi:MAG: Uma2 family endonuclease [Chloroflexi bacterium]|nr:Uma2 family endonuclease [Chloroflexota bacterium]